MPFPTIPTGGRVLSRVDTAGTATKTSPDLSSLTKNAGDLLLAIVVEYDGNSTNAEFSAWGGSFTEVTGGDNAGTTTMAIGVAYKKSTGAETGTFTVTTADSSTNDYAFFLLSIPGWYTPTAPEAGGFATGTASAADPASFDPAGWAADDNLWIAVGGGGEDATTGSFTGVATAPTNYTNSVITSISADVVGGVNAGVAFRQLNASAENVGAWSVDTSNARNAALVIAVRGAQTVSPTFTADAVLFKSQSTSFTANAVILKTQSFNAPIGDWSSQTIGIGTREEIAYGDGYWVTVGGSGALEYATSASGAWTSNNQGSTQLNGVAYGNGYWVTVGDSGTLYYKATDPTGAWTSNAQGADNLNGVTYDNGYWVAVGAAGGIRYAIDPTGAWTLNTQGTTTYQAVAYGNGYWVAVGNSGGVRYAIDPTGAWTSNAQGATFNIGVFYGNGYWVLVGEAGLLYYKATNPTGAWTSNTQGSTRLRDVTFNGGYWAAVGDLGTNYYKNDVPTGAWNTATIVSGTAQFNGIAGASGVWVVASANPSAKVFTASSLSADAVIAAASAVQIPFSRPMSQLIAQ